MKRRAPRPHARRVALAGLLPWLFSGCLSVPERDLPPFLGAGEDAEVDFGVDARAAGTTDARPLGPTDARLVEPVDAAATTNDLARPPADAARPGDGGDRRDTGPAPADAQVAAPTDARVVEPADAVKPGPFDATPPPPDALLDARPADPDGPGPLRPEVCNGEDDDGDGEIDEGDLSEVCYSGPPGTSGVGPCRTGHRSCVEGALGPCEGEVVPDRETCDGADEDCNGAADDDGAGHSLIEVCWEGPAGAEAVGACLGGFRRCEGAAWGVCRGQVLPAAEDCDGVDDDCDGVVDDGIGDCTCRHGDHRLCYSGPERTVGVGECRRGEQVCDAATGNFGPCEGEVRPTAETCNGLDDDCDGRVDDGIPGVGDPCFVERGACLSDGVIVCDVARGEVACNAPEVAFADERCDGVDNNCDGRIDEGFGVGAPCTSGTGGCARGGSVQCASGQAACDALPGEPADEQCNGADDDCDGHTDEFAEGAPLAQACEVTGGGHGCPAGLMVCADGAYGACRPVGLPELCDGLDNNCNGAIDEGLPDCNSCREAGRTRVCFVPAPGIDGVGICRNGERTCLPELVWSACVGLVGPAAETCDGLDNDCNGEIDEAYPEAEAACNTGLPGPDCEVGTYICVNGNLDCRASGPHEICDGADNDCDGLTDEGFDGQCIPP